MQPSVKNLKSYSKIPLIAGSFFWVLFFNVGFFIVSFNLNAGICCSKQTKEPSTNFGQPHAPRNSLASEESSMMSCENNFYSIALHASTQIQSKSSNNSIHQDEIDLCDTHQSDQVSRPLTPYSFDLEEEENPQEESSKSDESLFDGVTNKIKPATFINSHKFTPKPSNSLLIHAYIHQPTPDEEEWRLQKIMRKKAANLRHERQISACSLPQQIMHNERMNMQHSRRGYKTY